MSHSDNWQSDDASDSQSHHTVSSDSEESQLASHAPRGLCVPNGNTTTSRSGKTMLAYSGWVNNDDREPRHGTKDIWKQFK